MKVFLFALFVALLVVVAPGAAAQSDATRGAGQGYAHPDWLVSANWLKQHLDDPTVKVVALTPGKDFAKAHIPGAARIGWPDLNLADTSPASVAGWRKAVERKLTRLGIERRDTVVIYDGGTLFAARLWWVLDYLGQPDKRILNGGLPAWIAAGGKVERGAPTVAPAAVAYHGTPNPADLAALDEVKASLGKPGVVLIDARTEGEYARAHIPGAININYPRNARPEAPHYWKSAKALRRLYVKAGATPDKTIIPYCSTGVRSAVTYFSLRLIGYPKVALYTGSWAEWSRHPGLPQVRGDHPQADAGIRHTGARGNGSA